MKRIFVITSILLLFFACKHQEKEANSEKTFVNNLIASKACILYEQEMIVPEEYFFFKSIDFPKFINTLRTKSLNKEITAFVPFSDIECNDEDLQTKFTEEFNPAEFQNLLFEEEWALDTAQFIMKKKVNAYSLVRQFMRTSEYVGTIKTKSVVAKYDFSKTGYPTKSDKNFKLLANDVAYEVSLVNEENPEFLDGIQVKQVAKTIIEKAICGNVTSYSFAYRDTLLLRTLDEVKQSLGQETICYNEEDAEGNETDTVCVEKDIDIKEITGLAFIEDWYLNDSTMEIVKDVKAIAPVRSYYHYTEDNSEPELVKSIPFVMYLHHD